MNRKVFTLAIVTVFAWFALPGCKKDKVEDLILLDSYDEVWLGGWDGANGSGLDTDNGQVYGYGSLKGASRFVDIFFDRSAFFSYDADGSELPDVGTRFAPTSFTTAQFDAMVNDKDFRFLEPKAVTDSIRFALNDVVLFKTRLGKKGLIKIISMTSPTGDLKCALKTQER
ncbi:hypothetical protein [Chitinophaga defluvii]|uniref:Uncharacterized protein n=1 Tax=Chitinophaga defluvii TaxID=3163343 RepID=A0ABV2TB89_9BACT